MRRAEQQLHRQRLVGRIGLQCLQLGQPLGGFQRLSAAEQMACGTLVVGAGFTVAAFDRAPAHPQRVARSGQCHVPQAQVFAQAVVVSGLGVFLVKVKCPLALAIAALQGHCTRGVRLHHPMAVRKRQADHRILQTLAGVDGDDLDQVLIAFEPHGLFFTARPTPAVVVRVRFVHLLGQPADHSLLAVQLAAGRLQQLRQVQDIGQAPLAVQLTAPTSRQLQCVQGLAQHGEYPLALPCLVQLAHLLGTLVQQFVLRGQRIQLGERQAHGASAQSGAHAAHVLRLGHAAQPQTQVLRFVAGKHRITV